MEVEERESRRLGHRAKTAVRGRRRIAVVYDIDGPRVRLGIGWFAVAIAALAIGTPAVALVYGGTAAVAAAQTASAWRKRKSQANVVVAAAGAGGMALAAAISTAVLGLAILGFVFACFATATVEAGRRSIPTAARTLQSGVYAGGAAAAVACTTRFEIGAAVALVLVVSAYEIGDYIVGSGGRNALEGPIAGFAALLVVQFGVAALGIPPFELPSGLAYAILAAVLCPLGQLAASLILPSVRAPASALRRLDSLLLLGPVWALVTGAAAT